MQRSVRGEVVASTFDEPATRHVQVAEMVIRRQAAGREQEGCGHPARLDHAPGACLQHGRAGLRQGADRGVDANALQRPKRFFGAARNIEEGGSLTIIATALIDTGSRMDDVIYEEFKGTGTWKSTWSAGSPRSASTRRSTSTGPERARKNCC